jgi:hypothetical protein
MIQTMGCKNDFDSNRKNLNWRLVIKTHVITTSTEKYINDKHSAHDALL